MTHREDHHFISSNKKCAAWFYSAENNNTDFPAPCIILAHGFASTRTMRLDAYAEQFAKAGYHAFVFDYRYFGDSEGEPRQLLDIKKQLTDWRNAIHYVRSLDHVDSQRIILWGTSFSGGHVAVIAAEAAMQKNNVPPIAAVISQVPHVSGFASASVQGIRANIRLAIAGIRDMLHKIIGKSPYYIATFGKPGSLSAMARAGEYEAANKLFPEDIPVRRDVAARIVLSLSMYSPIKYVNQITMPWLVQVATNDVTTPANAAIKAAQKAPKSTLKQYSCGHFDPYVEPLFSTIIKDQIEFLKTAL